MARTPVFNIRAASLGIGAGLLLSACSLLGGGDVQTATASFGDAIGRFKGGPVSDVFGAYGKPTRVVARPGGRVEYVWKRQGTTWIDWESVPQDCTVTLVAEEDGTVASVVAGGNSLYCAEEFGS